MGHMGHKGYRGDTEAPGTDSRAVLRTRGNYGGAGRHGEMGCRGAEQAGRWGRHGDTVGCSCRTDV